MRDPFRDQKKEIYKKNLLADRRWSVVRFFDYSFIPDWTDGDFNNGKTAVYKLATPPTHPPPSQ